jgi:hypothetical protein
LQRDCQGHFVDRFLWFYGAIWERIMTNKEWSESINLDVMIRFLCEMPDPWRTVVGQRKLRLWGCACCRLNWEHIREQSIRDAVELAERMAEGIANSEEIPVIERQVFPLSLGSSVEQLLRGEPRTEVPNIAKAALALLSNDWETYAWAGVEIGHPGWRIRQGEEGPWAKSCADLLRCIIGNPFHSHQLADSNWIVWNGATIIQIAQLIYTNRQFQDLPILADALEEAGCANHEIIAHCRLNGDHALGCWVIDSLLGKVPVVYPSGE